MSKCQRCGAHGLFLKLSNGLCPSCVQNDLDAANHRIQELELQLTPEIVALSKETQALNAVKRKIADLEQSFKDEQRKVEDQKQTLHADLNRIHKAIDEAQKQLIVVTDDVEFESFSLYRPKYDFVKSEEYKERLDTIREKQKNLIKNKLAATCSIQWTVDGNKAKGKKMTNDNIKLVLRSFNNECDIAVSAVRFNNFDRCKERITRSFDMLNKISETNKISISHVYYQLKIEELHLALEYQQKKQEEKEKLRELRAQQREEARLAKEIEEARKEAEKEKKHYLQALEKVNQQLEVCNTASDRADLLEKKEFLSGHINEINSKLSDIDYRQANQKAGYVYVISNIGSFGEGIYKIGMTRRLDPMERVEELGDASVPFYFDVHAMIFSEDAPKLEAALHHAFEKNRVNLVNNRREYFRISLDEIKRVVRENHDKTVEFTDIPSAEQYRESLMMASHVQ